MTGKNIQYRDSLFRSYFSDKVRLLSLCNALLGTDYTDTNELEITTLEGTFFDEQKNDISCTIGNNFLILAEHQTSINNNMPLRCLFYLTELLNNLIEDKRRLYRKTLIRLPAPKIFVFYDGDENELPQREMKLSDAFGGDDSTIELTVTSFNINKAVNHELLEKCGYLNDYSTFVGKVKESSQLGMDLRDAITFAVKYCMENGVMTKYLKKHGKEVFNMLAMQWDAEAARWALREDAREEGLAEGLEKGLEKGFASGLVNGIVKVALNLIRRGTPLQEIHEDTELSYERIRELAKENNLTLNE